MNDRELCELFGTTVDDVERGVAKVESGDYSDFDFSKVTMGRPFTTMEKEKMETISTPVPMSRIAAMREVTERLGISRSEFVRRAIEHELLATA
ncbi:MAG: hypothetical protein Q4B45_06955 [Coriobacteriia bacterium]|nr:hypothetical protein [Coriobacteriia bacterium]